VRQNAGCGRPAFWRTRLRQAGLPRQNREGELLLAAGSAMPDEVEALTQDYGREIFARCPRSGPFLFSPRWWDDRLMEWSMSEKDVKVQLFRFVDVLPRLKGAPDIVRHLREYFAQAGDGVPGWMRLAL